MDGGDEPLAGAAAAAWRKVLADNADLTTRLAGADSRIVSLEASVSSMRGMVVVRGCASLSRSHSPSSPRHHPSTHHPPTHPPTNNRRR